MIFLVSPGTVLNPGVLETRRIPKRILGRVMLWPRHGPFSALFWRVVFEAQVLRYTVSLLPFVVAVLVWQESALAIAQAPLPMFALIWLVEMRFLRVPPQQRAALINAADAERGLDLLQVRARAALTRIAAGRGMAQGSLHLVVEQSELARVAPLTLVSVQSEDGPQVLRLSPDEQALLHGLFQPPLTEAQLHLINLSQNAFVRDVALEARGISAHARLAALMG